MSERNNMDKPGAQSRFHGVIPAMATPFTRDGDFDERAVAPLIDGYLAAGVHGISVAGSQGEFFSLNEEERSRLIEISVAAIRGRVPLYAGTGGLTTRDTVASTRAAERAGADLALVITPYFIQPTQEELVEHIESVAKATALPVMLYNNPPRTSVNVLPSTLARCMKLPNVVGIKDSSGDVTQAVEYLLTPSRPALLFSGRDTVALSLLVHGGHGTISPAANVFPELMVRLYECYRAGDLNQARRISDVFAPLRAAWAFGSFPVVIKEAMALAGRDVGPARRPILPLSAAKRAQLRTVVDAIQAESDRILRTPAPARLAA